MPERVDVEGKAKVENVEPTGLTRRAYAGADDLRRMEQGLARHYDFTWLRVGDLAWLCREWSHRELSLFIELWEDQFANLAAWTFVRPYGEFTICVAPGYGDSELLAELWESVEARARAMGAAGDPPAEL